MSREVKITDVKIGEVFNHGFYQFRRISTYKDYDFVSFWYDTYFNKHCHQFFMLSGFAYNLVVTIIE